jgi:hypothetical protein
MPPALSTPRVDHPQIEGVQPSTTNRRLPPRPPAGRKQKMGKIKKVGEASPLLLTSYPSEHFLESARQKIAHAD